MSSHSHPTHVSGRKDTNLRLFPEETSRAPEPARLAECQRLSEPPPACTPSPSLTQVVAAWGHVVERLGRRRRVLEAILTAGRPVRVLERTLVVGFSPQRLFHKELLDAPDYRTLLEEEISRSFGVMLKVATMLVPEPAGPRRAGGFEPTSA